MFDRIVGCTLCVALLACGPEKPEPEIASSAPHQKYAATYPERVDGTLTAFSEGQLKVKELSGNFSKYPEDYPDKDKIDYEVTAKLMERADEAGHSQAYVDGL